MSIAGMVSLQESVHHLAEVVAEQVHVVLEWRVVRWRGGGPVGEEQRDGRCLGARPDSLDGDLIREIDHDMDPADPLANHDSWNLITRHTQLVVSGLYYWTVEDEKGQTQIGKLAIIL